MDKGGAEPLVRLLTDPKPQTQVNSAVCLTNLANNGTVLIVLNFLLIKRLQLVMSLIFIKFILCLESWRAEINNYGITSSLAIALNSK